LKTVIESASYVLETGLYEMGLAPKQIEVFLLFYSPLVIINCCYTKTEVKSTMLDDEELTLECIESSKSNPIPVSFV